MIHVSHISLVLCFIPVLYDSYLMDLALIMLHDSCYILLFHNLLNMKYHQLFMPSSNTKHDISNFCIKCTNIHWVRGKYVEYRYAFVFTVVLGCAPCFRSYLRYSRGPRGVLPPFLFYCHDKGIHKTLMLGLAAGSVFKQRNNTGPWSRACTGPTVNIVRRYNRCFQ